MPFVNQVHTDKLLSNVSVKYRNKEYIADQVFPTVPVKEESNVYRIYSRNFRLPNTLRADKAMARDHDFQVSTGSYLLQEHAIKDYVTDRMKQNYDMADLRADTVEELTDVIMRRREREVADLFTSSSWSLGVSLASGSQFSDNTTTVLPTSVFDTGATTILNNSGFEPNFGIISRDTWVALKNHTSILDRIKYTQILFGQDLLASLLGIDQMLISRAQIDSSAEGQTESIGNIWSDVAFLGYRPPRPSPKAPSSGYIFQSKAQTVKRWRDEERSAEAIEVSILFQPKIVASLTGYLINDTLG